MKRVGETLAILVVLPSVAIYLTMAGWLSRPRAFPFWTQLYSLLPGLIGVYLRRAFYRFVLPQCDQDACIGFATVFSHPTARVGRGVYIGVGCMIGDVTLEDDVLLGSHVSIINGSRQHGIARLDLPVREQPGEFPRVTIGRDTWIGDRAVVMVDVGKHCVVGAGSVVTKPLPDYAIAVGNPARIIAWRDGRPIDGSHAAPIHQTEPIKG